MKSCKWIPFGRIFHVVSNQIPPWEIITGSDVMKGLWRGCLLSGFVFCYQSLSRVSMFGLTLLWGHPSRERTGHNEVLPPLFGLFLRSGTSRAGVPPGSFGSGRRPKKKEPFSKWKKKIDPYFFRFIYFLGETGVPTPLWVSPGRNPPPSRDLKKSLVGTLPRSLLSDGHCGFSNWAVGVNWNGPSFFCAVGG